LLDHTHQIEPDGVAIVGHARDNLRIGRYFHSAPHDFPDGGIPLVPALESELLDHFRPIAEGRVDPVDMNGLVCPVPSEPELAPGTNVPFGTPRALRGPARALPAARALSPEYSIDLREGQAGDRIVFVDKDDGARVFPFFSLKPPVA